MKLIRFSKDDCYKYEIDTARQDIIIDYTAGQTLLYLSFEEIVDLYNTIKDHYSKQPINL